MADDVIDRRTGRFRIAAIIQRCRERAVIHAELEHEAVDFVGGHARLDDIVEGIKAARRQIADRAHTLESFRAVKPDLARIFHGCACRFDIGYHHSIRLIYSIGTSSVASMLLSVMWHRTAQASTPDERARSKARA